MTSLGGGGFEVDPGLNSFGRDVDINNDGSRIAIGTRTNAISLLFTNI